ncbi:MAG: hypothetical protein H0V07_01540, partial [Propionibacteriales bacterium]|nr:hypothetical protein [Propionibacteriales bacterium]
MPAMRLMLAERGTEAELERLAARGFWFDLKIDGIRALVTVQPGASDGPAVSMTSRNGLDLTGRYPELVIALQELPDLPPDELVLDAEIAVPGSDGFPSWPLTHRRTAQRGKRPVVADVSAVLYVFDVLRHQGR